MAGSRRFKGEAHIFNKGTRLLAFRTFGRPNHADLLYIDICGLIAIDSLGVLVAAHWLRNRCNAATPVSGCHVRLLGHG